MLWNTFNSLEIVSKYFCKSTVQKPSDNKKENARHLFDPLIGCAINAVMISVTTSNFRSNRVDDCVCFVKMQSSCN